MAANAKAARSFLVSGRVQGVGFRYFVLQCADRLGLGGYVRNTRHGAVEVYAVGSPKNLENLAKQLWEGPPASRVEDVQQSPAEVLPLDSFQVKY